MSNYTIALEELENRIYDLVSELTSLPISWLEAALFEDALYTVPWLSYVLVEERVSVQIPDGSLNVKMFALTL